MKELSKVSVCIPAYNKESEIGAMLESVCNQKYSNIEVNIVNNGSTDCTLKIIREWEPRFIERGYDVVIVSRENRGLPDSAKTLLTMATGDYICMPDADDILHCEYVSDMARILDERDDVMWAECQFCEDDSFELFGTGSNKDFVIHSDMSIWRKLIRVNPYFLTVWKRLVRSTYVKRCKIVENFIESDEIGDHESLLCVPLFVDGVCFCSLSKYLYYYKNGCYVFKSMTADGLWDLLLKRSIVLNEVAKKHTLLCEQHDIFSELGAIRNFVTYAAKWSIFELSDFMYSRFAELVNALELVIEPLSADFVRICGWAKMYHYLNIVLSEKRYIDLYPPRHIDYVAIGNRAHFDALKPYLKWLIPNIKLFYDLADENSIRELDSDNNMLVFADENAELIEFKEKFKTVISFKSILYCAIGYNYWFSHRFCRSDEELIDISRQIDLSTVCVWGCGKRGRELLTRFSVWGYKCLATDMNKSLHGLVMPNGAIVEDWQNIKEKVKIVIVGAEKNFDEISRILSDEYEILPVNW
jgi:glycosyltransferase involved in cell wall biosynthesis